EDMEVVGQFALALFQEQLPPDEAALLDDLREEARVVLGIGESLPVEKPLEERMSARKVSGVFEIGKAQSEERRQPRAKPAGPVLRLGQRPPGMGGVTWPRGVD